MKFNYEWMLSDAVFSKDKGSVFSCFSCGGGSTMGYKLAGFDVIGCNEIDPRMMDVYRANHNPKYSFLEPIQNFKNRNDLTEELYNLDILDGSPPCSSFSFAGNREKDWGKKKKFREGQSEQVLDTLFFDFIELAAKLRPKIVVAENVKGLLTKNAKSYVDKIYNKLDAAGYITQHFLLNAAKMGVPQRRERVFFIAIRKDLSGQFMRRVDLFNYKPTLNMSFSEKEIPFKEIRCSNGNESAFKMGENMMKYWHETPPGKSFSHAHPKGSYFNEVKSSPNRALPTIRASGLPYDYESPRTLFDVEILKAGTFPKDFNFLGAKPCYFIGMSVPPVMIAHIATRIYEQWLSKI